jgi:hypothetical protein
MKREFKVSYDKIMDVEDRLREIFEISSLAQKVQELKEVFFEIYPDGDLLNKEKEGLYACPLMAILFRSGNDSAYVGKAMFAVKLDEDVLMGLCHDDEFVAKFKPLFNEAAKERIAEDSGDYSMKELEGRFSKLSTDDFNLLEHQRRVAFLYILEMENDSCGEKIYNQKDGERMGKRKQVWEVRGL